MGSTCNKGTAWRQAYHFYYIVFPCKKQGFRSSIRIIFKPAFIQIRSSLTCAHNGLLFAPFINFFMGVRSSKTSLVPKISTGLDTADILTDHPKNFPSPGSHCLTRRNQSGNCIHHHGVKYTTTHDNSYQFYRDGETGALTPDNSEKLLRKEYTLNMYTGASHSFGKKFSAEVSLAAELYHAEGRHSWMLYPL